MRIPLVTACLSANAATKIHDEFGARIRSGTILEPNGGFDPRYYPGEVLASVMAISQDMGDQAMMDWATSQLDQLGLRLEASNGFLLWPEQDWVDGRPTFGELAQSRLVLAMALIFKATGSATAKRDALLAFSALERMPLADVKSSLTGKTYRLPYYAFHDVNDPAPVSGRTLDPNHDAALAAAYTVMAKYVLDDRLAAAQASVKADEYLAAASDMATFGKCLPLVDLPDYIDVCDSRYNGFWSFLLEIVARSRPETGAAQTADIQFAFAKSAVLSFQTHRTYPQVVEGGYPDLVEPLLWIPTAARNLSRAEFLAFVDKMNAFILNGEPGAWPSGSLYPKYYE